MSEIIRYRKFNTANTYPEQSIENEFCQAVVAEGLVFLRGQVGQRLDTSESVGIGSPELQAEQALDNIETLLREAGSSMGSILKITTYIVDPRHRESVYNAIGRRLRGVFPISTGLVVSGLARPEWLVEIDVIAAVDD